MNKKDIEVINPLSPAQQGMLYESIRAPESGIHIEQVVYTLTGKMDLAAFEQAWQWGVDRHAILRTGFVWKTQVEPLQVTLRRVRMALDYQDWRNIAAVEQQVRLESYLRDDRIRGFQLAQAPLMRLALFHLDEQAYRFAWTFHHILMDGWSRQILLNEVIACYAALSKDQTFYAPPCPAYSDYIAWLKKQNASEAEDFWRKTLHGFNKLTPLGIERVNATPDEQEKLTEPLQIQLSETIASNLQSVVRSHHLTLNTLLQGLWAILLGCYSHSEDVVFGVTVSGRPADMVGVEAMVGLCINTLPMRVQLPAQVSFWSWLSDLQCQNVEMHRYEHCSAGQIHRWSDMPGKSLLYESLLVVENYPSTVTSAVLDINLAVDDVLLVGAQTKYALTLLAMMGARLTMRCIYNTRLFARTSVRCIMDHLQLLLEYVANDPQVQLATLANLIPADQIPLLRATLSVGQEECVNRKRVPRNPIEELVAAIWCDVLGLQQVDIDSDFFKLGGHSLIATQMVSRLRAVLGVEIPLRTVFESPTLATLAPRVEQALRKREGMEVPPLLATERPGQIPLSFAQQRLWFLEQLAPGSTAYLEHSAYRMHGLLDARSLESSLEELIHRHENLRTTFSEREGQPLQIIHPMVHFTLPVIDLQALRPEQRAEEVRQLTHQEALYPADLVRGPLIRVYLLYLEKQQYIIFLTLHHIITDRWSTEILVRELITLYRARVAGKPSPLAPLPIQYADYALWQRQLLQGETLQQQIAYWKEQLWRAKPLELPTDVPRALARGNSGAIYTYTFSTALWKDLVSFSQQEGVTLFMLLLTVFQVVLYRVSGQTDIVLGTDVANRTHVETEGLIGFFVNLLALRIDLQGTATFRNIVRQVRSMVLGAYAHQELPFELVVEHVQRERNEHQLPLVQALFVMQNTPPIKEELPGITFEHIQEKHSAAKFDLAVFIHEGKQGISASVVYRTALFKEQTIATLLRRFEVLARSAVVEPETSIDGLELYSDADKAERSERERELYRVGSNSWRNRKTNAIDLSELALSSAEQKENHSNLYL